MIRLLPLAFRIRAHGYHRCPRPLCDIVRYASKIASKNQSSSTAKALKQKDAVPRSSGKPLAQKITGANASVPAEATSNRRETSPKTKVPTAAPSPRGLEGKAAQPANDARASTSPHTLLAFSGRLAVAPKPADGEQGRRDAAEAHKAHARRLSRSSRTLVVYADGSVRRPSGLSPRAGASAIGYLKGRAVFERCVRLPPSAKTYDAELAGLRLGLHEAMEFGAQHPDVTNIYLFCDDTFAVQSAFGGGLKSGEMDCAVIQQLACTFLVKDESRKITIAWVPGHKGIEGNTAANGLARRMTSDAQRVKEAEAA